MKHPPVKRSRPFGMPDTPFDPRTGAFMPLAFPEVKVAGFVIDTEHGDFLMCYDRDGNEVRVAKPFIFRKSIYDGKTLDGITYVHDADNNVRKGTNEDDEEEWQAITPSYYANEPIFCAAFRHEVVIDDDTKVECRWIDINTAGRCWAVTDEPEAAT